MHVIIKHIPKVLVLDELENHLKSLLKGGLFRKPGELKALRMLNLHGSYNNTIEAHALAWVDSVASKNRLIKAINAGSLQDTFLNIDDSLCNFEKVKASEFAIRHFNNDRRMKTESTPQAVRNQRSRDRRRNLNTVVFAQKTYNVSQDQPSQNSSAISGQLSSDGHSLRSWAWNSDINKV